MDGLAAGRRGEGAAVGGVLGRVSRHQGGLRQPPEPNLQYSTAQYWPVCPVVPQKVPSEGL